MRHRRKRGCASSSRTDARGTGAYVEVGADGVEAAVRSLSGRSLTQIGDAL
ncbi:hypothetical protein GCM10009734_23440 [Nonomuraea bangladeshensis]